MNHKGEAEQKREAGRRRSSKYRETLKSKPLLLKAYREKERIRKLKTHSG